MLDSKDYTKMTLEELAEEEKKMKSQRVMMAVFIGFLIGIAVYSAVNRGFILPVILLIVAFLLGRRNSQTMKDLQAEITRRKNGH
ncbi:hypothetical protein [Emticicia sp. C21]|uniref:hypothetical protein n=1 Tax=Emticicia sp. C21 TaxID=2302915 RepID=UPI000E34E31A|nr:hypothetical protein [Emticicia sp. C21]RFS17102.1 hypothetical protein D0T08_10535 [Emticicia sp. C21]